MNLSPGLCAQLACIWEATARKPGNVHRFRDFDDTSYVDFLVSAAAIAPVLEAAHRHRIGQTLLNAVFATCQVVSGNTNLGIILLLTPLAAVPPEEGLRGGLQRRLADLDLVDAQAAYTAIRIARPAGLGRVQEQDINEEPTLPLRQIMTLAAERDLVASQYANGYREVFYEGLPALEEGLALDGTLETAIVGCHLRLLASHPDSLIVRKCGVDEAAEASRRAKAVLQAGWPHAPSGQSTMQELDAWLRAEGQRRNPGTTADLVTACLFVALREEILTVPSPRPWSSQPKNW